MLSPAAAEAQTSWQVPIWLRSADGSPISGALGELLDERDSVVAEGLTSESGIRLLRAASGSYKVRVRRIGYVPFFSQQVKVPTEGPVVLAVESPQVSLRPVLVESKSVCGAADLLNSRLAAIWEEVAKGLHASELSASDLVGAATATVFRRQVRYGGEIVAADTSVFEIKDRKPFGAKDPAALARGGYVRGGLLTGWTYFGPDETSLLSDAFLSTHCFHLVTDKVKPHEVGLGFEPTHTHNSSDIKGVFWLDTTDFELREVVFRFTNSRIMERFEAGGFTRFRRVPSGAWIVDSWYLRGPMLEVRPGAADAVIDRGYVEDGGWVEVHPLSGSHLGRTSLLTGFVFDSVTGLPLSNATVSVRSASTSRNAVSTTDANGRFTLSNLPRGTLLISFAHPGLSLFGVRAFEREVTVQADSVSIALATPSIASIWRKLCPDSVGNAFMENRGIVHGVVTDAAGNLAAGARVKMTWTQTAPTAATAESIDRLELMTRTDNLGHYSACGFRRASRGIVTLESAKASARTFEFGESLLVRRDLRMAPDPGRN